MSNPKRYQLKILYQDNHLIAVNKPAGLLVQGDRTGDLSLIDLVRDYLRVTYHKPGNIFVGLIHRLDRPVSGLVLLAKTSKALTRMNRIFSERNITKVYWALTENRPPTETGTLSHWLKKNPKTNRTSCFNKQVPGSKHAQLNYTLKMVRDEMNLLEVIPTTGRSHQIRVQLSVAGCPIQGDVKYGDKKPLEGAIALHARRFQFEHPIKKKPLILEAPLPSVPYWRPFLDKI